ncbi:molybdenum ABC transporter ATP-binding protein [Tianweitania sediminis]|uniref:Molybdenum ABC transporter ATP-binding protein n=1 Tax=Tianweitania sediminis TaxID=1502156 RepID=A0A8J7R305_9HYPH|nr:molybdenum ABC transporter ATP-binding protein [Tianweitania sediminis]MBP0439531.1 molybdenum ABC transporter ATP-binding protein [Tianweitania sediminis]
MSLQVDVRHHAGSFGLDMCFENQDGLLALFGPSGSGKTTLVNLIAGLAKPRAGRISVDGAVLVDVKEGVFVPPHKRRVGYVFQDPRLFPHLTVLQNLRYGEWFTPSSERYASLHQVVDLLGIRHLLARRPAHLSGGEKQRVAIGRALLASPRLILMDEPLAALDDARKAEILPYIEQLRDELRVPIVYVSHSVAEVSRLASHVILMRDGQVTAQGPVETVLTHGDLLPLGEKGEAGSILHLVVQAHDHAYHLTELQSAGGNWFLPLLNAPVGARIKIRVRARDVTLALQRPVQASALNIQEGHVASVALHSGPDATVAVAVGGEHLHASVTRRSVDELALRPGVPVFALVKSVTLGR